MQLVSKKETFAKLFFLLCFSGLLMYAILAFYTFQTAYVNMPRPSERIRIKNNNIWKRKSTMKTNQIRHRPQNNLTHYSEKKQENGLKYIIVWSQKVKNSSLGQDPFLRNNCSHVNCYITSNRSLLNNVTDFEAVLFNLKAINTKNWENSLPLVRSPHQKYIFFSMLPSDVAPVCHVKADGFFNWTWSYKRYSDIATPFILVKDMSGKIVGPRNDDSNEIKAATTEMSKSEFDIEDEEVKNTTDNFVGNKTKTLAVYFTQCDIPIRLRSYIVELKDYLANNNHIFDVYGCDIGVECPKEGCLEVIKRDYYFYLVCQNHNSEDYVTDEVLKAYDNNVVPVVLGGSDYSRFLPFGSYINAAHESMDLLTALISYTINSPGAYQKFFTWKKFYTIQRSRIGTGFCKLCEMLNDKTKMETHSSYTHFRKWWYYGDVDAKCLPREYKESKQHIHSILNNDPRKKMPRIGRGPRETAHSLDSNEFPDENFYQLF